MKRVFGLLLLPLVGSLLVGCAIRKNGSVASSSRSGRVFDITAYGAVDNPNISSADAFRAAIADCQKAGGGIVRVPAGHFLTGPIDMVDNMTLQVDTGAVVLFDTDRAKYPDITSRWEGLTENGPHPLLFANSLHNITSPSPAPALSTDKAPLGGPPWTWPKKATPAPTAPSAAAR
jgi:hypothetical protein